MLSAGSVFMIVVVIILIFFISIMFRRVVPPNMTHVVQSRSKTLCYGIQIGAESKDKTTKNVYFEWPRWIPLIGVIVSKLPTSNFDLSLQAYEAYDSDRVPFIVDVTAFFCLEDVLVAARKIENLDELRSQLKQIVQGAVRKVLANDVIDKIMLERSKFGNDFTREVEEQLKEWGVRAVKSMELMDIRDNQHSSVIANIMAKKISHIEMESRREVAENNKTAQIAEIEAKRLVDLEREAAEQAVGERRIEKEKVVGTANEHSQQTVLVAQTETTKKAMDVKRVQEVESANINREKAIVIAEQEKQQVTIDAEARLEASKKEAEGIAVVGKAKAEAQQAMNMADVEPQIRLAGEIGNNPGYQNYLNIQEAIEAQKVIGIEQAVALAKGDLKVIANAGKPNEGIKSLMQLFTPEGGLNLSSMVELFAATPLGESLVNKMFSDSQKPEKTEVVEDPPVSG